MYYLSTAVKFQSSTTVPHHSGNATPTLPVPPNEINVFLLLLLLHHQLQENGYAMLGCFEKCILANGLLELGFARLGSVKKYILANGMTAFSFLDLTLRTMVFFANFISRVIFY